MYRDYLKSTMSQKLKIEKLIFHSFQNIAQQFEPKNEDKPYVIFFMFHIHFDIHISIFIFLSLMLFYMFHIHIHFHIYKK